MTSTDDDLHLDPRSVEEYFRLGVRAAFVLGRSPFVQLEIDPDHDAIDLTTPALGSEPEVTAFERLTVTRFTRDDADWFRLRVDAEDMHYEAYVLLESVADQLRAGASLRLAVSEAILSLKDLLSGRRRLTEEKEIGLIGELLVLQHVLGRTDESTAVGAWLGPLAEEHDFAFETFDAEVKTTKSESRSHVIGSDTQLESSPGRPLHLVSIQLTRAGRASQWLTLPSLIDAVRATLAQTRRTFDLALEGLGWHDADADLYTVRWQYRSIPRSYRVDDQFPAITSARLDQVVPNRPHVGAVTYRIDVTDLDFTAIGFPLDDFCEVPE